MSAIVYHKSGWEVQQTDLRTIVVDADVLWGDLENVPFSRTREEAQVIDLEKAGAQVARLLDKNADANYSLWNAILTANSLAFAAAAFLTSQEPLDTCFLVVLLLTVVVSSGLVLVNFRSYQEYLRDHLLQYQQNVARHLETGSSEIKFDDDAAEKKGKRNRAREAWALGLMFVVVGILFAMILF